MSKPVSVNKTSPTKLRINLRKIKLINTINKLKEIAQAFTQLTNTSDDKSVHYKKIINLLHKVKENKFNLMVDSQVYDLFMNEDEKNVSKNVDSLLDEERELCFKKNEIFAQFIEQLESEENCVNLVQD